MTVARHLSDGEARGSQEARETGDVGQWKSGQFGQMRAGSGVWGLMSQ